MLRSRRVISRVFVRASLGLAAMTAATTLLADNSATPKAGIRYDDVLAGAYSVVAEIRAKPGKESDLRAATLPLIKLVRSDPNNLVYFLQEDRESPGHFVFYEVFASKKDFEAHNNMPYVQAWFAKLPELAQGNVKVMRMEVLTASQR